MKDIETNKIQIAILILTSIIAIITAAFQGLDYFNDTENSELKQQVQDTQKQKAQLEQELKAIQIQLQKEKQKPDSLSTSN